MPDAMAGILSLHQHEKETTMHHPDDILLPLAPKRGVPAIIKAKLDLNGDAIRPAWVLPGGAVVNSRREAYKSGMAIFKAAGWK